MKLAGVIGKITRAPSDVRAEDQERFLRAWRHLAERTPGPDTTPSFLSFLTEQEATHLSNMGKQQMIAPGSRIYVRGDRAHFFGLVLQGTLVVTDMQDLRIRIRSDSRSHTPAPRLILEKEYGPLRGRRDGSRETEPVAGNGIELHQGDTFGEIPFCLDGQLSGGKRESSLGATDDPNSENIIFTIDYKKFAIFIEGLPPRQEAPTMYAPAAQKRSVVSYLNFASWLLPKVLPERQDVPAWVSNTMTSRADGVMASRADGASPSKKKGVILDAPPVTMVNMDVMMECAWMAKREEGMVSETTRAIVGVETRMPHTVVYHDGEMTHWYFGWLSGLKRRAKENVTQWQVLEDFCKGVDSGPVAILTCCRRGNHMGTEHVQCRILDRRKLEIVMAGAKNNNLTGYIQKYQRAENLSTASENVLQCCWSNNSFTVDWVPESMLEFFSHVYKPSRMDPGGFKKLNPKMNIKYHHYVSGTLSMLGDHLKSHMIKMNPLEQLDGRAKARARQFNDGTEDARIGNIVERDIRDTVKTACQQIASTFDKTINKSQTAKSKAIADAAEFNLNHNAAFTLIRTLNCFFKLSKDGQLALIHCTAAMAHPETKHPVTDLALSELINPSEETFLYFAGYGAQQSRLSALGERAVLLDFSEFLSLLTKKELLYTHVSVTDASLCFKHACKTINAEEGQLRFPEYCECMRVLRERVLGLDKEGKLKRQRTQRLETSSQSKFDTDMDVDDRLAGFLQVQEQQERERGRLGSLFAATMLEKMAVKDLERRASERDHKHKKRIEERRRQIEAAAKDERKAQEEHRLRALAQATQRQLTAEETARQNWEKIEQTSKMILQKREEEARKRQADTESRRLASLEKLKMRRQAEEHILAEVQKRSDLLEQHRTKVVAKQKAVKDSTKEYRYIAVREKEVVSDMFHSYVRTGHLARPWGLDVLKGDALPSLIEIAADKSQAHAPGLDNSMEKLGSLLSVMPEKGHGRSRRSQSSLD